MATDGLRDGPEDSPNRASLAKRDDESHTHIRLAALPHVEVELHAHVLQQLSSRSGPRVSQAALIKAEVGLVLDALDEAIDRKHRCVETVLGGLDLAFDG